MFFGKKFSILKKSKLSFGKIYIDNITPATRHATSLPACYRPGEDPVTFSRGELVPPTDRAEKPARRRMEFLEWKIFELS